MYKYTSELRADELSTSDQIRSGCFFDQSKIAIIALYFIWHNFVLTENHDIFRWLVGPCSIIWQIHEPSENIIEILKKIVGVQSRTECRPWKVRAQSSVRVASE
jgi:hypothetical protein